VPQPVVHFDITGPDEAPLHRFYGELLGWDVQPQGPGYALVGTGDGSPRGAIVEGDAAGVALGVAVDDLDAAVANGWVVKAQVRDPAGNLLTLVQR
jgi:predicted enzyme related to lactoylglutathione lyase